MTAITIAQGTDGGCRWLVNDGASKQPYDFTGWTVRSMVRRTASAAPLHEWSTALGTALAGANGYVTLYWSHAETSSWIWTDGVFDLELTSPDGKVTRLDSGRISVSPEVTR